MTMSVVPIARKSTTSSAWNPQQCVEEFLRDITSGTLKPTKIMICFFEKTGDGNRLRPRRWYANLERHESIALHEIFKLEEMDEWRGR